MSDDLITRLRDLSVTLSRFRSDDEVDEALHDAAARIADLEAENDRLRAALQSIIRFGWPANIETNPEARMLGGKKPSTAEVWTFPKHMLAAIEAIVAEAKP